MARLSNDIVQIKSAIFKTSAPDLKNLPPEPGPPEVAFIGRSKWSKSSLINLLTRKKDRWLWSPRHRAKRS